MQATIKKKVRVVIPPYLKMFNNLKGLTELEHPFRFDSGLDVGQITTKSVPQIYAGLRYSTTENEILFRKGDLITMCLTEGKITVCGSLLLAKK